MRRRCLFTSAGERNVIAGWLHPSRPRSFDLVVAYYGDSDEVYAELSRVADRCVRIKGGKYQNAWNLWRTGVLDLQVYDHVWLADDDMRIDPLDIERCFRLAELHGFWVSSPAHDPAGKISNPFMARDGGGHDIRIVTYIEVTWPLFRADKLEEFFRAYDGTLTCWGVDHWYAHVLGSENNFRFAIFDCISAINTPDAEKGGQREIGRLVSDSTLVESYRAARERHGFAGVRPRTLARITLEWDLRLALFGPGQRRGTPVVEVARPAIVGSEAVRRADDKPHAAALTPEERDLLASSAAAAADISLYGAPWVLPLLAAGPARRILAVDADRSQCEAVLMDPIVGRAQSDGRLDVLHVDVGALAPTGRPVGMAGIANWPAYPRAPWPAWERAGAAPGLVVVMGIFRKACCLSAFMHWTGEAPLQDRRVLLRNAIGPGFDFAEDLAPYFSIEARVGGFVLLAPRPLRPGDDGSHASFLLQRWQLDVR